MANCRPLFLRPFVGRRSRRQQLPQMLKPLAFDDRFETGHPVTVRSVAGRLHQTPHRQYRRLRRQKFLGTQSIKIQAHHDPP